MHTLFHPFSGIRSVTPIYAVPPVSILNFSTNSNIEGNNLLPFLHQTDFWALTSFRMVCSVLVFYILLYINYKIYCKKVIKSVFWYFQFCCTLIIRFTAKRLQNQRLWKNKTQKRGLLMQLISLTISKCIIVGFIFVSIKQKYRPVQNTNKLLNKNYVLSIEHYTDSYNCMKLQTKSLHEGYAIIINHFPKF